MDYAKESLRLHSEWRGKLEVTPRAQVDSKEALSLAYTPGVAQPCLEIQKDINKSYDLTRRWNTVAVVTDGTAVLGLGDIGPEAGMPVMEGNACCLKNSVVSMQSRSACAARMWMILSIPCVFSQEASAVSTWRTSPHRDVLRSRRN